MNFAHRSRCRCHQAQALSVVCVVAIACALATPAARSAQEPVRITILYDNTSAMPAAAASWGFSCLVQSRGKTVLFDAGGKPDVIRKNAAALKAPLSSADAVVFSHEHGDHTSGVAGMVFSPGTPAYVPAGFKPPGGPLLLQRTGLKLVEITESVEILPGFRVSDALPGAAREIALSIESPEGLVVVCGCAHPGVVALLKNFKERTGQRVHTVIGGFHLLKTPGEDVQRIIGDVRSLGVLAVGPTHCTGDQAIHFFREAYGPGFISCGAGAVMDIPDRRR